MLLERGIEDELGEIMHSLESPDIPQEFQELCAAYPLDYDNPAEKKEDFNYETDLAFNAFASLPDVAPWDKPERQEKKNTFLEQGWKNWEARKKLIRDACNPDHQGIFTEPGRSAILCLQNALDELPAEPPVDRKDILEFGQEIAPQIWEQISTYAEYIRQNISDEAFPQYNSLILRAYGIYIGFCRQFEIRGQQFQNNLESLLDKRQQMSDANIDHADTCGAWDDLSCYAFGTLSEIVPEAQSTDDLPNEYLRRLALSCPETASIYLSGIYYSIRDRDLRMVRKLGVLMDLIDTEPAKVVEGLDSFDQYIRKWQRELSDDLQQFPRITPDIRREFNYGLERIKALLMAVQQKSTEALMKSI